MTDRYENIRRALEMGPTPGPWRCEHETGGGHDCWMIYAGDWPRSGGIVGYYTHTGPRHIPHVRPNIEAVAIAHHIVACDPDTIRALLAERDALAAALEAAREDADRIAFLAMEPVIEGFVGVDRDVYDYACDCAEENGRDEPNDEDHINAMRRLIDAAIDQARGKENGNVR